MAGGHNAKSPEAVSKDVAAAREKRASEVAEAKQDVPSASPHVLVRVAQGPEGDKYAATYTAAQRCKIRCLPSSMQEFAATAAEPPRPRTLQAHESGLSA